MDDGSFFPRCPLCDEPILPGDQAECLNGRERGAHLECLTRGVVGSVGHQKGECSCFGKVDTSEEGMTRRDAARAARTYFLMMEKIREARARWG